MDFVNLIKSATYKLSAVLNVLGVAMILLMTVLIVADILSRLLFNVALQGPYELVEYIMGLVIVFAIGYTQVRSSHVRITSLTDLLPLKTWPWADRFANLVGGLIFGFITWETVVKAGMEVRAGTTSAVLFIPKYPFMYACAFGFGVLTLVYLMQTLLPDERGPEEEEQQDLIV